MFKKPFKVKANTQVKNSEIKLLKSQLLTALPNLTQDDLDTIIPKKETVFCMKAVCADERVVNIYLVQKRPITFSVNDRLFPTVYLLWKFPKIALTFTTTPFVVTKIKSGADLMLPGVIEITDICNNFGVNTVACVNTSENKAAIAVGLTSLSSCDIKSLTQRGKCVIIYHFYGDKLCIADDMPILPLPDLGLADYMTIMEEPTKCSVETETNTNPGVEEELNKLTICDETEVTEESPVDTNDNKEDMDVLLELCLLSVLKYSKTLQIPILTSAFYKFHMIPACPVDRQLDVKKSSYKKLGQFLKKMMKDGIIVVKEQKKGAEFITAINKDHPSIVNFFLKSEDRPKKIDNPETEKAGPSVIEEYIITPAVLPLFSETGLVKGDRLPAADIRKYITNFVKKNNCQDETNKALVKIENPHLGVICKNDDIVTWEVLMQNVYKLMKPGYKLVTGEEEKISKGKIQPINITVETRTGNKKVTLVDNLELFGIRITDFAKECQHGVAASATITKHPGKKCEQLLIQGNQVLFVYNHLTEKYKVQKKYIKGLEYAPKHKK